MMQCTPEQIEQKRKQALAKLQAKKLQSHQNNGNLEKNIVPNPTSLKLNNNSVKVSSNSSVNVANNVTYFGINNSNISNNNGTASHAPEVKNSKQYIPHTHSPNYKILPSSPGNKSHSNSPYGKPVGPQQFFGYKIITGTICMITESRFEVNLSGYHEKAIEIFKSMPTRSYDPKSKMWNFDLKDYDQLCNKLQLLRPELTFGKLPGFVLKALKQSKIEDKDIDLSRIDSELFNSLLPFQREGVCFGIKNNGRLLIADDMGLGKTFQALAIANYYKGDWPLLIVTTSSMRNTWEETIQKYLPSVPLMSIQYMVTSKDYIFDSQVLIVSHDMMGRNVDKLVERKFGVIILDESHVLKNFKTKCSKSASMLAKAAKRIILLSGTPALSRPNELYSQLSLIDEKFFGDFFDYSKRYCDGKSSNFGWDSSGKSNLAELEIVLSKKFMIRRSKSDVLDSLPNKTREVIKLDVALNHLSNTERTVLNELINNFNVRKAQEKHSALLTLFSETARIKIPSVCTYILQVLKQNIKFLIFAHHQKMLDAICTVLNKHKKDYIRIDGNTSPDQRKYFVDKFQLHDSCICAVLSITAANAGITMTAAQIVLFAELHWNPSILAQAEGRAHRIGQLNQVDVRYLLAEGTADDYIWPMLLSKQDVLSEVGLSKESFKDTTVSEQAVTVKKNVAEQKLMKNWLQKENHEVDENVSGSLMDDDDDFFANINI